MTASGIKLRETFFPWEDGEVIAGADLDKARLNNFDHNTGTQSVMYDFPDMTLFSPYLAASQYFGAKEGFHLAPSAGVRGYVHTVWANMAAPQAGLLAGYDLTSLRLGYSWAVVYPAPGNILDLARDPAALASADLKTVKPERAYHYEAELSHVWPELFSLSATVFYDDGRDRIISGSGPDAPVNDVSSASYFRISGLELGGSATPFRDFEIFGSATLLRARAKGKNGYEVDRLPYTPEMSASAGLSWTVLEHVRLSGDYQYVRGVYTGDLMKMQGSFSDPSIIARLDDQHLVNLRLACFFEHKPWNIARGEVFFAVNNLLNRKYEYSLTYEMPGVTFMAGADIKFR
jgi:iron complex outermembrane receptor protein